MSEASRYKRIYDYLRAPNRPSEHAGLLVFGRKDPLVAYKAGEIAMRGLGDFVVITGGFGKDSGDLSVPESVYLGQELERSYPGLGIPVHLETQARNGGENVRNSLDLMDRQNLPYSDTLTTVSHATSSRRLTEMAKHEADRRGSPIEHVYGVPTDYDFDPENPADQAEARAELLRLADWPGKDWLPPQPDLPEDLVDFVRDTKI